MIPLAQADFAATADSTSAPQLTALLKTAGVSPVDRTAWIRVTGEDRVRWLNGMVTNSIQQLQPNQGNYNFLLNAQGRIQGDATIFAQPDALLIETDSSQAPNLIAHLDHFIIMDDVELADISATRSGILVAGPQATSVLAKIGLNVEALEPESTRTVSWKSSTVTIIHAHSPLVPKFELWTTPESAPDLLQSLQQAGAVLCEPQSLNALRILEGTPLYAIDIRNSDKARELPQETNQTRALHFAKGCYLGQEIVERIRSRGNVHRTFAAFRLESQLPAGQLPAPGSALEAEGKPVGELTSVANLQLPSGENIQLALGYIRREALERSNPIHYPGGTATPIQLPYSAAAA
jgi:folate-binding protein YgfZ